MGILECRTYMLKVGCSGCQVFSVGLYSRPAETQTSHPKYKVYGDEAQFTKENDKFTALMFNFTLHREKGVASDQINRLCDCMSYPTPTTYLHAISIYIYTYPLLHNFNYNPGLNPQHPGAIDTPGCSPKSATLQESRGRKTSCTSS